MNDLVKLFREALRVSKGIDNAVIRRKFRYNARDIIETYQNLDNDDRSKEMLARAPKVLETFRKIFKYNQETDTKKVLQSFEPKLNK